LNDGRDFDPLLLPVVVADKSDGHRGGSAGQEHHTAASAENARHLHHQRQPKTMKKMMKRALIHVRDTQ
jgi:hypothetical protein